MRGYSRGRPLLAVVGDERSKADRDAFARMDPDARQGFFYARSAAGISRNAPAHDGAALYVAGFGQACLGLSAQWNEVQGISATPFAWVDPRQIPPRSWIYGRHYARKFISATVAPGGVGKSSLTIVEALSIASGRALLNVTPDEKTAVWLWNGEDPLEELQRRVAAAAMHHGIGEADLAGRLYVDTGREMRIVIAEQTRSGATVTRPVVDKIIESIRERGIGLMVVDPFVACHRAAENDNNAIEAVAAAWAEIADVTGAAIELVHHSRKTGGAEVTVDDARGAGALLAKARSARVINGMTSEEAAKAGVDNRRLHFRCENGKANLAVPVDQATWYRLTSVELGNGSSEAAGIGGDSVGVVTAWTWPDALEGVSVDNLRAVQTAVAAGQWRENSQATNWVGKAVAGVLGLDATNKAHKSKIASMLKTWVTNGMLVVVTGKDAKGNERPFVEVGEPA